MNLLSIASYAGVIRWLETHELPCPVRYFLGVECPGCGLQRSFVELLKGNIRNSWQFHPVTIPLIFFFIFAALHLKFKFEKGNSLIIYSYLFIALIVISHYIYSIINHPVT